MEYSSPRREKIRVQVGASVSDGVVLQNIFIPSGRGAVIWGLKAVIDVPSPTASATIELATSAGTVLDSVSIEGSANTVATASGVTYPYKIASATSDQIYQFVVDQATGVGCNVTVELDITA